MHKIHMYKYQEIFLKENLYITIMQWQCDS